MTLTLYTIHVVTLPTVREAVGDQPELRVFAGTAAMALVVAVVWGSPDRRGPLEALAATAARSAAGASGAQLRRPGAAEFK